VLTAEIPTAADARHEGHPHSVFGFTSNTLAGAAGFGHCYVSMTGRIEFSGHHSIFHDVAITAGNGSRPPHGLFSITNTSVLVSHFKNQVGVIHDLWLRMFPESVI
jgi:hypothetical protein